MEARVGNAGRRWWHFGDRARAGSEPEDADAPRRARPLKADRSDEFDSALDLIARSLRLIGEVSVVPDQPELSRVRATCEAWARHILTHSPPPGNVPVTGTNRAWNAVAEFIVGRRHAEQELVAGNLAELRQAV